MFLIIKMIKLPLKVISQEALQNILEGHVSLFERDFPVFLGEKRCHVSGIVWC